MLKRSINNPGLMKGVLSFKKTSAVLLLSITLFACSDNKTKQENEYVETDSPVLQNPAPTTQPGLELFVWRTTYDYKKIKNKNFTPAVVQTDSLLKGLNAYYPEVYLEKIKMSGDTLYTAIRNSEHLTQQMGSTGAEVYLADVILNLTSVPGTKFVNIAMEEGDHAGPGTWSAGDFKKYKEEVK